MENTEGEACLRHLMNWLVAVPELDARQTLLWIARGRGSRAAELLPNYGLRLNMGGDGYFLYIKRDNADLRQIFADTKWADAWAPALMTLAQATHATKAEFAKNEIRIPLSVAVRVATAPTYEERARAVLLAAQRFCAGRKPYRTGEHTKHDDLVDAVRALGPILP